MNHLDEMGNEMRKSCKSITVAAILELSTKNHYHLKLCVCTFYKLYNKKIFFIVLIMMCCPK